MELDEKAVEDVLKPLVYVASELERLMVNAKPELVSVIEKIVELLAPDADDILDVEVTTMLTLSIELGRSLDVEDKTITAVDESDGVTGEDKEAGAWCCGARKA